VLFDAPTTDAAASICIEMEQNSGTTYIDNVELYEANATVYDINQQLRFEYNATKVAKTVSLDASYTGVDGTVYSGTITLQPFTSLILVKDAGTTTTVPPPAVNKLAATATAPAVNCFGDNAAINVSATGGTAPYTGTGTFTGNDLSQQTLQANTRCYIIPSVPSVLPGIMHCVLQQWAVPATASCRQLSGKQALLIRLLHPCRQLCLAQQEQTISLYLKHRQRKRQPVF
jgi:hypothetical protein